MPSGPAALRGGRALMRSRRSLGWQWSGGVVVFALRFGWSKGGCELCLGLLGRGSTIPLDWCQACCPRVLCQFPIDTCRYSDSGWNSRFFHELPVLSFCSAEEFVAFATESLGLPVVPEV